MAIVLAFSLLEGLALVEDEAQALVEDDEALALVDDATVTFNFFFEA